MVFISLALPQTESVHPFPSIGLQYLLKPFCMNIYSVKTFVSIIVITYIDNIEYLFKECQAALKRITVTRIDNIYELIQYLHHLKASLSEDESCPPRVVIVDSMPALFFPFMASEGNQGTASFIHFLHLIYFEADLINVIIHKVGVSMMRCGCTATYI